MPRDTSNKNRNGGGGGAIEGRAASNLQGERINSVNEAFADDLTAVYEYEAYE